MLINSCFYHAKHNGMFKIKNNNVLEKTGNSEPITEIERSRCDTEQPRRRSVILEDNRSFR